MVTEPLSPESWRATEPSPIVPTVLSRGIAPNAKLISLRVLDDNGPGTDSNVINAINFAIANKAKYNIRVMNLSLGRPMASSYTNDPLCQAVQKARNAGIVVVVEAGNEGRNNTKSTSGYGTIASPGNSPYVITIGAYNTLSTLPLGDDEMTSYSSKGPPILITSSNPTWLRPATGSCRSALGSYLDTLHLDNIVPVSAYTTTTRTVGASHYFQLSGTSFAAPMFSGAAALLIQKTRVSLLTK